MGQFKEEKCLDILENGNKMVKSSSLKPGAGNRGRDLNIGDNRGRRFIYWCLGLLPQITELSISNVLMAYIYFKMMNKNLKDPIALPLGEDRTFSKKERNFIKRKMLQINSILMGITSNFLIKSVNCEEFNGLIYTFMQNSE